MKIRKKRHCQNSQVKNIQYNILIFIRREDIMRNVCILVIIAAITYSGCKENIKKDQSMTNGTEVNETLSIEDPTIELRYGVAFKDGKALYLDPDKLDQSTMMIPKYAALKYQELNYTKIPAGILAWGWGVVYVYDTEIDSPRSEIWESERRYIYTIENNTLYLSTDEKNWEKVEITVVDENPPQEYGPFTCPVYMIVHLKCKWFENDYEIIGPVRDDLKYQKKK